MTRWLCRILEVLLYPLLTIFSRHVRTSEGERRIGVLEVNRLGDLELMLPALQLLRRRVPRGKIFLIGPTALFDLLRDQSCINSFVPMDVPWMNHQGKYNPFNYGIFLKQLLALRRLRLDACVDTRGDLRRHILMALAGIPDRVSYDRFIGGADLGYRGRLLSRVIHHPEKPMHRVEENCYLIEQWLPSEGRDASVEQRRSPRVWPTDRPIRIALHSESHWPNKMWNDDQWISVMEQLHRCHRITFYFLSPSLQTAHAFAKKAAVRGIPIEPLCVPLRHLRQRLGEMDFYLGVDSGPMHVADSQGCHVLAIFGPSDTRLWHAYNNGPASVIQRQETCPYAPCGKPWCRTRDTRCMSNVSVEQVLAACDGIFPPVKMQNLASSQEPRL